MRSVWSIPAPRAWEKRFGNLHNHIGFWCAEPKARADFRKTMLARFGGIAGLNARWGTAWASEDDVGYPATPDRRRHFLDFAEWYYDGMIRYTREWLRSAAIKEDRQLLADLTGPGAIQQIWMTPTGNYRYTILRFYWDGESTPSVEVPVGDFFASAYTNFNTFRPINSLPVDRKSTRLNSSHRT